MTTKLRKMWAGTFILVMLVPEFKTEFACDGLQPAEVTIKDGGLRGSNMISVKGKPFCAFLGIPFAEPPVGKLRFKPPQPIKPWKGIRDATKFGNDCVQPSIPLYVDIYGTEDCLYLNVYTPKLEVTNASSLPVMVFISGGAFYMATGSFAFYRPHLLMDKDIVLVTLNYRVGAFGFLSTEDDESPGNYGMKDQVAVLRWIKDNIAQFGGNPNKVTISGQSSGAASVHFHMLSPLTKGLFSNAISMEGTAIMPWARHSNPRELAKTVAKLAGCPIEPSSVLVECLRHVSVKDIFDITFKLFTIWLILTPGYTPVIEKQTYRNPEPFLTSDPFDLILSGNFQKVPWLMGSNSQSSSFFLAPFYNLEVLHDQALESSTILWPKMLLPGIMDAEQRQLIWKKILRHYGVDPLHIDYELEMTGIEITTDRFFTHGTHKAALLHSLAGHKQIYRYHLAYRSWFSTTVTSTFKNYGVSHSDELRYIFHNFPGNTLLPDTKYDLEVRELVLTLWTNFVKFGNPTPPKWMNASDSSGLLENLVWETIGEISENNTAMCYFNIGQVPAFPFPSLFFNNFMGPVRLNMAEDLSKSHMEFWDSLPLEENVACSICKSVDSGCDIIQTHFVIIVLCMTFGNFLK